MRVGVIEDEPLSAKELVNLIYRYDSAIQVDPVLDTVRDTVDYLSKNRPDLLFLDIELADGSSFDIFDQLEVTCPVVFTTAYDSYAIKAFEKNSISYLLKPITFQKLEGAFSKFSTMKMLLRTDVQGITTQGFKQSFLVKSGNKLIPVKTSEVLYFNSRDNLTYLVTEEKKYLSSYALNELEQILDPGEFIRASRQYIVSRSSVEHLQTLGRGQVALVLQDGVKLTVSRDKTAKLKDWLS